MLDESMSGETMALRVIKKINSRLKYAWYPNLSKKLKNKLQVTQNKFIRFCLKLQSSEHISNEHFQN